MRVGFKAISEGGFPLLTCFPLVVESWSRNGAADFGTWYIDNNYFNGNPEVTNDNWKGVLLLKAHNISVDPDSIPDLKLDKPSENMNIGMMKTN